MADLNVDLKTEGNVTLVYPRGFINAHTVRSFEQVLQEQVERKSYRIVINCADLRYISSAGLGALMGVIDEVRENQGDIKLSNMSENIFNIFDILGFTHLYKIFKDEAEALGSFSEAEE
jgi:anti-sigma B factor antagonist